MSREATPQELNYYNKRIKPNLHRIERLSKRGLSKQEIAKRLDLDYKTLLKHSKIWPELRDVFLSGIVSNADKVAKSLVQAAIGYEYTEKETIYDELGDVVQVKVKTKKNPPNVGAANRILKMVEEYYGIDEQLKAAQVRNIEADAHIKEEALKEVMGDKKAPPILALMEGLRTVGVNTDGST